MEKNTLYITLAALAGVVAGVMISSQVVNNQNYGMMSMMGMRRGMQMMQSPSLPRNQDVGMHGTNMGMSMSGMSSILATLRDDEFDETFLNLMIDHHQGAINMAQLVATNTNRQELKDLANGIISAQTREINQMTDWLNNWF